MQKTANQIKSEFELLASGHFQIHSFLYAQEFEQQAYENLIYPLMLVYPLGGNLSGTTYSRNYRVIIADRVLKSEGNELEVESDTQLIALDVLAYWMKLGQNERFSITSSNTITPFWEKWGDEVTGHFVDIGIEEFYDFNSCAIPLSGSIPSPTNPCKDARILINSVIYGNAPSDTNFNVVVKDQLGALVGSLIGGEWIVNTGGTCADATYTIEDSLGNVLYTGTIPSGGSVTEVIGNSTLNVNKSDGTLISSRSILAEGTESYNVADSSAVLKDESGNVLSTTGIKATESKDIVAPNGDVSVNSVDFDDVLSGGTLNIEVRKSTGNDQIGSKQGQYWRIGDSTITNSDSTYDVDVKATESLVLPDSQINVNSVDSGDVVSVKTIDVNLEDSVGDPVVPTSVGLVGNTLTIEVPSGATPMDVDFSADKLTAAPFENITFTDLSDQIPTHWSWRFDSEGVSILQNPTFSFSTTGFKNITLLSGKVGAGGVEIKNSYIEIVGDIILTAFISAFNTAVGGTMGITQQNALQGFINRLRGIGTTFSSDLIGNNKISALYPYVPVDDTTANSAGMALDLFLNSNGTFVNFVSGDFAPSGVTGGGTKYLNTNYNPVAQSDSITDFSFGFDAVTSTTATTNPMGVRNVNNSYTAAVYAAGNFITGIAETANLTRFASANMPANLNLISVLSTTKKVFNAGVEIDSITRTGSSFFNGNFYAHASNSINVAGGHDPRKFRGFVIGKGLTNNESADLNEAWLYLQQNIITGGR
jgi:PKD repeat protein